MVPPLALIANRIQPDQSMPHALLLTLLFATSLAADPSTPADKTQPGRDLLFSTTPRAPAIEEKVVVEAERLGGWRTRRLPLENRSHWQRAIAQASKPMLSWLGKNRGTA